MCTSARDVDEAPKAHRTPVLTWSSVSAIMYLVRGTTGSSGAASPREKRLSHSVPQSTNARFTARPRVSAWRHTGDSEDAMRVSDAFDD